MTDTTDMTDAAAGPMAAWRERASEALRAGRDLDDAGPLDQIDLERLRGLRDLLADGASAFPYGAVQNAWDWNERTEIDGWFRLVADEVWRREDAEVDEQTRAAYAATRMTWSDVRWRWPLAPGAWERKVVGDDRRGLVLLRWSGSSWTRIGGRRVAPLVSGDRLLALDAQAGCELQGPLDKSRHAAGCRCWMWSPMEEEWTRLSEHGIPCSLQPGQSVEGLVRSYLGPDAFLAVPGDPGTIADLLEHPLGRIRIGTRVIAPRGRVPIRLLMTKQLDRAMCGLSGRTVRVTRISDLAAGDGARTPRYAVRPISTSVSA
jgi:hypothetical protein